MQLTAAQAQRLLLRLALWRKLREAAAHPAFATRVARARLFTMPPWWRAGENDRLLVERVCEWGLDGDRTEWIVFLSDSDCPLTAGCGGERAVCDAFMRGFVCDSKPLLQRLRYLAELVIRPATDDNDDGDEDDDDAKHELAMRLARDEAEEYEELSGGRRRLVIERDADGAVVLPIESESGAVVDQLGTVNTETSAFHARQYIFPVGYKARRKIATPDGGVVEFSAEVRGWGDRQPTFVVSRTDAAADQCWQGATAARVWQQALKSVGAPVDRRGTELFGFDDATVRQLIEELPGARDCWKYAWKADAGQTSITDWLSPESPAANPAKRTRTSRFPKRGLPPDDDDDGDCDGDGDDSTAADNDDVGDDDAGEQTAARSAKRASSAKSTPNSARKKQPRRK